MAHNFKKLQVWQKSMDFTDLTYDYCRGLHIDERFNLIGQINRSFCSIPSNIAEGSGKRTYLQFAEYLSISLSSSYEAETQLVIYGRRNYGIKEKLENCLKLIEEVQRMIFSFREHILKSGSNSLGS